MVSATLGVADPCALTCAEDAADPRTALLQRLGLLNEANRRVGGDSPKRESRRLSLLKRTGLFADNPNVRVTRAMTVDELCEAYRVVHDIFVTAGYIRPLERGMRVRSFEALPDTATFVALQEDEVVGVQSLVLDSPEMGLPSDESFRPELDAIRGPGRRICEATNEAVVEACRRSPVPTELMRCMFAHALASGCHELITTVSPGHAKFYELLGFQQISPVRSYSQELNDPVVVVRMRLDLLGRRVSDIITRGNADDEAFLKWYYIDVNPYFSYIEGWERESRAAMQDPALLWELFVEGGQVLPWCSQAQRDAVRQVWGEELHQAVLALADRAPVASRPAAVSGRWRESRSAAELAWRPKAAMAS
jgi:hypothetical protein